MSESIHFLAGRDGDSGRYLCGIQCEEHLWSSINDWSVTCPDCKQIMEVERPAPVPTYRLTLAFTTPIGTTFHEVAHVEYPGNPQEPGFEDRLIAHFLQDARNFYGEIRVEPVPHFSGPLRLREGREVKWFE